MALVEFTNNQAPYINADNLNNNFNELNSLITNLNTYSVLYKGSLSNVDLNDYKKFGIYYFYENCSNAPANYLYCLVMGTGGDCVQIGMSVAYDNIYVRRYINGSWVSWRTI